MEKIGTAYLFDKPNKRLEEIDKEKLSVVLLKSLNMNEFERIYKKKVTPGDVKRIILNSNYSDIVKNIPFNNPKTGIYYLYTLKQDINIIITINVGKEQLEKLLGIENSSKASQNNRTASKTLPSKWYETGNVSYIYPEGKALVEVQDVGSNKYCSYVRTWDGTPTLDEVQNKYMNGNADFFHGKALKEFYTAKDMKEAQNIALAYYSGKVVKMEVGYEVEEKYLNRSKYGILDYDAHPETDGSTVIDSIEFKDQDAKNKWIMASEEKNILKVAPKNKVFAMEVTRLRRVGENVKTIWVGTIDQLRQAFSYSLECGQSWEHEKGNKKINTNPTNIKSLVSNLDKASANSCRYYQDHYYEQIDLTDELYEKWVMKQADNPGSYNERIKED